MKISNNFLIVIVSFLIATINVTLILKKVEKIKYIKFFLINIILFLILYKFINAVTYSPIITFINIFSYIIIKRKLLLGAFTSLLVTLVIILVDNVLIFLLIKYNILIVTTVKYYVYSLLLFVISLLITNNIVKKIKITEQLKIENVKLKIYTLISMVSIIFILLYINITVDVFNYEYDKKLFLALVSVLIVVTTFMLIDFSTKYIKELSEKEAQIQFNKMQKENLKTLETMTDLFIDNNHYLLNLIIAMEHLITKGDINEIREYFDDNLKSISREIEEKLKIKHILNIENEYLKTIFIFKIILLQSKGINVQVKMNSKLNTKNLELIDSIKIFGEIFDNIIKYCKNEVIIITEKKGNKCLIKIINDFEEDKKGTGFGLHIIRKVAKKYDYIDFDFYVKDNNFITSILL